MPRIPEIGPEWKLQRRLLPLTADAMPPDAAAGVIVQPAYEWMLATPESSDRP